MSMPSMEPPIRRSTASADPLSVVLVTDDSQYADRLETHAGSGLEVQRARSFEAAASVANGDVEVDVDAVDCLVIDRTTIADDTDTDAERELTDTLERIGQRVPDLPIVLLAEDPAKWTAAVEATRSVRWGECLERSASPAEIDRLTCRIEALVERRHLTALSRRTLAGIELAGDAIAIVAPDGTVEFANRAFAMQFGYDRDGLRGRSWRTLFTDDSVERLETTAVPTVADGWRWTGTCTGRLKSGRTIPVRVRLGGPEDGGLVFVVEISETDAGSDPETDDSR